MVTIMTFINRTREREELTKLLMQPVEKNRIILLSGYSGVGKTGLMHQLFSTTPSFDRCLQVHISKNSVDTIDNGAYFNALYKEMVKYSSKTKAKSMSPRAFGLRNYKNIFSGLIHIGKSKIGLNESDKLYESAEESSVIRKRDYILYILKKTPFLIDFENIQNIDTQSIELLRDIMDRTEGNTFILEFTQTENSDSVYENLYAELLQFNAEITSYALLEMKFDEAIRLLPQPIQNRACRDLLENTYTQSHGNLMQVKLYQNSFKNMSDDIIRQSLSDLSKEERFLVYLIHLNGGSFSESALTSLLIKDDVLVNEMRFSISSYQTILGRLQRKNIIEKKNTSLLLHDSVADTLKEQPSNPVLYGAYASLTRYYLNMNAKAPSRTCIFHLFSLYINFADEQIFEILPEIRDILLESKYPQNIMEDLNMFQDKLLQKSQMNPLIFSEVCMLLAEVCLEIEDTENAWIHLSMIPSNTRSFRYMLLKAKYYAIGSDNKNLKLLQDIENMYAEGTQNRLLIELCRLRFMLRTCTQAQSEQFSQYLLENTAYRNLPEYGFLLMNAAELVSNPKDAINIYQEAISSFNKYQYMEKYATFCYINLSMSYGYIGKFTLAKKCIRQAEGSSLIRASYVLNNKATLDLLESNVTSSTISNFRDSLMLTSNHFEELIIHNNLLIAYVILEELAAADFEADYIENSGYENYNYGEFLQMNYQNLLYYYRTVQNSVKTALYEEKIDALIRSESVSSGTRRLAELMKAEKKEEDVFYSAFPYRAEFLCYWGIPSQFYL